MPKAPRKSVRKSVPDPTGRPRVTFASSPSVQEYVPGSSVLLGVPASPGPLRNMRKYVYHLSREQILQLRAPHDNMGNDAGDFPWRWSSGVFERLQKGAGRVPNGTIKITIEMPADYIAVEMPRDLVVRDEAELGRMDREDNDDDDDSTDSGLSDLDDEMFEEEEEGKKAEKEEEEAE